ncbi:carboxypeptidase-like regulatory domain-containing protein [uncultured Aquimarina sp.]|uniref:carboxypeptidase-like regulatory domain-containing protein n=1 Tax=uncultured Aquimarina sp. TaxID=575652 RepID=UPI002629C00E|nr:carboxypeptidase-like regulatory domain-containing protein [uncultured Aquimarina sp.]
MRKLIILLLLVPFLSISQNIKGVVLDTQNGKALGGVNVYVKNQKRGTVTNVKGKFTLPFTDVNKDTIYFSYLGYKTKEVPYSDINKKRLTVYLTPNPEELSKVEIYADRKLKPVVKFEALSDMKETLYAFGSVLVDNKIYVQGGDFSSNVKSQIQAIDVDPSLTHPTTPFSEFLRKSFFRSRNWQGYKGDLMIYDIDSDTWNTSRIDFRKRAYHNIHFYNNKIYALGGKQLSVGRKYEYLDSKIEVFDLNDNKVSVDHTNPHEAADFASFLYDSRLIVMGGSVKIKRNGKKIYSDKIHTYNLNTGLWYELGNIPFLNEIRGALVNDKIFTIEISDDNMPAKLHTFNLTNGKWKNIGILSKNIKNPAIASMDHMIYFFEDGKLYTLDTNTNTFNEYLINLYLQGSEMYCYKDKLLILGGYEESRISKMPSSGLFSIDLNQIDKTRINLYSQL